jgi:hypothetical protein
MNVRGRSSAREHDLPSLAAFSLLFLSPVARVGASYGLAFGALGWNGLAGTAIAVLLLPPSLALALGHLLCSALRAEPPISRRFATTSAVITLLGSAFVAVSLVALGH